MSDADKTRPLTSRQQRFVDEYLLDLNATQAAIRAGYSARTANEQGARLLAKASVSRAVASAKQSRAKATGITAERVLEELALMAFSDLRHYQVDEKGNLTLAPGAPDGAWRAVQSVKHKVTVLPNGTVNRDIEIRLWDKPGTHKIAGRHAGVVGFYDKLEVTGRDGAPLMADPFAIMSSDEQRRHLARLVEVARARLGAVPLAEAGGSGEAGAPVETETPGSDEPVANGDTSGAGPQTTT